MNYKLICLSVLTALFSCQSKSTTETDKNSYESAKSTLLEKEKKSPVSFLVVTGHDKHNLIGQMVIRGSVTNKATVASFKDVDVKLDFYSKTGTLLETDRETVYEVIAPGESKSFKTKYFAPKGTDSVALHVLAAKPL